MSRENDLALSRLQMVTHQIETRGVLDPRVLEALCSVPREKFVAPHLADSAYADTALPIGEGQTISQPFVVALMVNALEIEPRDRILEIGTGSGYAAAVLSRIAAEVYTVERHESLARSAESRLAELGYDNVHVRCGDGTLGWSEHAPYEGIVVAAGAPEVPDALREQTVVGGRLVIPVGRSLNVQRLVRLRKLDGDRFTREDLEAVRFVPLVGSQGW